MKSTKSIQQDLINEVMLLLFALLIFVNWFLPAMIQSVYAPAGGKVQDLLLIQVVPSNPLQARLELGTDVLLAFEDDAQHHVLDPDLGQAPLQVDWAGTSTVRSAKIKHQGQILRFVAVLAQFDAVKLDDPLERAQLQQPIRVIIYRDADQFAVHDEITTGTLSAERVILTLNPTNRFQAAVSLPPHLFEKSQP